jgi:hypothetical protein
MAPEIRPTTLLCRTPISRKPSALRCSGSAARENAESTLIWNPENRKQSRETKLMLVMFALKSRTLSSTELSPGDSRFLFLLSHFLPPFSCSRVRRPRRQTTERLGNREPLQDKRVHESASSEVATPQIRRELSDLLLPLERFACAQVIRAGCFVG